MGEERARALGGLPALGGHLALAFSLAPIWAATRRPDRRRRLEQLFFRRTLRALGLELDCEGSPSTTPGTLFVANHISFADVLALATCVDAAFVAKSEVRSWPVLGWLAKRFGTLFVTRGRRIDARAQAELLAARLRRGENIIIFPEGTTSDGTSVLPFRSTLLAAAEPASAVQPVAIRYSDAARRAYVGDESLVANLVRLAPHRARLQLIFLQPMPAGPEASRKGLARQARAAIKASLHG
jgi:1-acyl-sn-glycerol-3-phosphate acyltransferase